MNTLSYGYKQPINPDTGDLFFPALSENWQQVNDHDHDGTDSAPLSRRTQSILAANWAAAPIGGGVYRQLVTLAGGLQFDNVDLWFRLSTGEFVYPSVEKASATTFYVYTNDNTLQYEAYYR